MTFAAGHGRNGQQQKPRKVTLVSRQIFVNLPVSDLDKSVEFFTKLGFEFNADFTNEQATMMIVNESASVMLLVNEFFSTFTPGTTPPDPLKGSEAIVALSAESREEVDELATKALEAGAKEARPAEDHGWMYGKSFRDLDGHIWELTWMGEYPTEG
jgi:uncharacterized protein